MKTSSTKSEKAEGKKTSLLSPLQKALLELLVRCNVEGDQLVGTMLMLKDSIPEQEEMLLYLWDNKPTPEEVDKKLVEIVKRRAKRPISEAIAELRKVVTADPIEDKPIEPRPGKKIQGKGFSRIGQKRS